MSKIWLRLWNFPGTFSQGFCLKKIYPYAASLINLLSVQPIICQKTGNAQKTENDHDRFVRVCQSVFPSTGVDEGVVYDPLLAMPFTSAKLGLGLRILIFHGLLNLWSGRW